MYSFKPNFLISPEVQVLKHGLIWALSLEGMLSIVWCPGWFKSKIFKKVLMLVEHVLITPFGGGECSFDLDLTNQDFLTTKWKWLVCRVDVINRGVSWNELFQLSKVTHIVVILNSCWNKTLDRGVSMESHNEWENWFINCVTVLIDISEARETNLLSVVGVSSEMIVKFL